jgi:membrane-bound ClpP family serine protease
MTKGRLGLIASILFIIGLIFYILVLPMYAKVPLNEIGITQYILAFITLFCLCMGFGIFMIIIHEKWERKKEENQEPEQEKEVIKDKEKEVMKGQEKKVIKDKDIKPKIKSKKSARIKKDRKKNIKKA